MNFGAVKRWKLLPSAPSTPPGSWQLSLILQCSEPPSVIKNAAGAAPCAGITLPSGAGCHSNVARKEWWTGRRQGTTCLCLACDKLSVQGQDSVWQDPDQLCSHDSVALLTCQSKRARQTPHWRTSVPMLLLLVCSAPKDAAGRCPRPFWPRQLLPPSVTWPLRSSGKVCRTVVGASAALHLSSLCFQCRTLALNLEF